MQVNVVCANIIVENNKILFVKEVNSTDNGRFSFPAGKLEFGETLIQCAKREALEESGLDVEPTCIIGIYQRPKSSASTNTTVFDSVLVGELSSGNSSINASLVFWNGQRDQNGQ